LLENLDILRDLPGGLEAQCDRKTIESTPRPTPR